MSWAGRAGRSLMAVSVALATLVVVDRIVGWVHGPVVKPVNAMGLTTGISAAGTHLRPGFEGTYRNAEFAISVRINSSGLRGPEIPRRKLPDEFRVLALGDSFTFGQGVEYEQAWPAVLERSIGVPVTVLNAGWAAGSPLGYERYLVSHGYAFEPDLVLIALFVGNDVVEDMVERTVGSDPVAQVAYTARYVTNLRVRVGPMGAMRQFIEDVVPNLYELATLALVKGQYLVGSHRANFDYVLSDAVDPELEVGWKDTLATLDRIERAVASRGQRTGIVIIPFHDQVAATSYGQGLTRDRPQKRILSFCAERGIACLDLMPALRGVGAPASLYYLKDGHWTPRGQQVAATAIAEWLLERSLVPAR